MKTSSLTLGLLGLVVPLSSAAAISGSGIYEGMGPPPTEQLFFEPPSLRPRCTEENVIQRKEWSDLTRSERLAYIDAVKCTMALPSRFPPGLIPAARNVYDDFTAVHIQQALRIHLSGIFLGWHRHMLHLYEEVLHTECGYPAYLGLPYWQWTKYSARELEHSAIFDGSDTSLGSNGDPDPNAKDTPLPGNKTFPHGTGGLCVTKGPFANTTVTFGPFDNRFVSEGLPATWAQSNERCLTRDINPAIVALFLNPAKIALLQASENMTAFQEALTPMQVTPTNLGSHRGGHNAVGGPMVDFFASPMDCVFYLHHSEVDRQYENWVRAAEQDRRFQYNGTSTTGNPVGVTPEVDNSTVLEFGVLGGPVTLGSTAYTTRGRYCYRYI